MFIEQKRQSIDHVMAYVRDFIIACSKLRLSVKLISSINKCLKNIAVNSPVNNSVIETTDIGAQLSM